MRVQLKNNGYTLSADFPAAAFAVQDMPDSLKTMRRIGGEATAYGAVSGRGQSLYAALTVQPEQRLAENFSEDESQEFHMELGGMRF